MISDPIKLGLAAGWQHINGAQLAADLQLQADVVVIGSGAGGGTSAQILAEAGFKVIIIEAGPLKSSSDFKMQEKIAYPDLYQQSAAMKTKDGAIAMLQGRCVGGSTTVNWTTSIRTPEPTLTHWQQHFGLTELTRQELDPWFEQTDKALNIHQWQMSPNQSNDVLAQGCQQLGWDHTVIERNVNGCANLGYCGMGCPINAKQSMLVTTVPAALNAGATLLSYTEAWQLQHSDNKVTVILCRTRDTNHQRRDINISISAKHFVLCGGALHSPALLLRSKVPDPHQLIGRRTFLHPVLINISEFDRTIAAHSGAPQSIYSDQFLWPTEDEQRLGYKMEAAPLHPILLATKLPLLGEQHAELMQSFQHLQMTIALLRDGFGPNSPGGTVELDKFGDPLLDYPLNELFWKSARHSAIHMAKLQFAAGAKRVALAHDPLVWVNSVEEAELAFNELTLQKYQTIVSSAHIMGGCGMGASPELGVVNANGEHHQLENLSIFDGSVLPTSLGANPQVTLYGLARRNCTKLLQRLSQQA
ncbi:GMC family oxidoreductase [Ferrimonas lipolytica]|uniref:GMC family oxidoreductase n=1 Tax=Ferrimonas lipolytica TaxID=2724191 RepID=A0A6H1UFG5_9GAMM|nr:GMC family oxidoreductase [Ferrimonas lipolytica]QIZ77845.1 GMC family oxidoreductase [Ferrimonas lipolytica]